MDNSIIKKLIFSRNSDDNILGYSYLQYCSIEELKDIIGAQPGGPWKIVRNDDRAYVSHTNSRNYMLGKSYHVHDYGEVAYFYTGVTNRADYIQL